MMVELQQYSSVLTEVLHQSLEHLDPVVLTVTHQNVAIGHDSNSL